ncbi:hypothetical protein [Fibrella forsythiae]|uniref:Uncharacterized protein n=1 Tax=Fibrella forsythiae TaxID=2817061 RepID=A0ABS3JFB1_9BACT|nr:hypothetical protein [Fibrella forsythiae]MBO0948675.1 hypothetical protein [Fibrella forsythiae]
MPKHIKKWLLRILLNFVYLLLSLGLMYVAAVVVILTISTRAVVKDPLFGIINYESLLILVVSVLSLWLVYRYIGKIYSLLTTPPKPE